MQDIGLIIPCINSKYSVSNVCRYKNNVRIPENTTCYRMSGHNLAINEVKWEHSGLYTLEVKNRAAGLARRLNYSLQVEGTYSTTGDDWGMFAGG